MWRSKVDGHITDMWNFLGLAKNPERFELSIYGHVGQVYGKHVMQEARKEQESVQGVPGFVTRVYKEAGRSPIGIMGLQRVYKRFGCPVGKQAIPIRMLTTDSVRLLVELFGERRMIRGGDNVISTVDSPLIEARIRDDSGPILGVHSQGDWVLLGQPLLDDNEDLPSY
ncbi:hypothetical protein Tco_1302339 [Tanacetum coccineum]